MVCFVEVFGLIAGAVSVIDGVYKLKRRYGQLCATLDSVGHRIETASSQAAHLRHYFDSFLSVLGKYDRLRSRLDPRDQREISRILSKIDCILERCEEVAAQLRNEALSDNHNPKRLGKLEREIDSQLWSLRDWRHNFDNIITLEILDLCLSSARTEPQKAAKVERYLDSRNERIAPIDTVGRTDSTWSGSTLTPPYLQGLKIPLKVSEYALKFANGPRLDSAVRAEDFDRIQDFIEDGRDECEVESRKASALLIACRYRKKATVFHCLQQNADVHLTDDRGFGTLHSTIGNAEDVNEPPEVIEILNMLIQHGADMSAADGTSEKQRPIHYCAIWGHYKAAEFLLREDARIVNQQDANGKTALYYACTHHSPNANMISLFLQKGATFGNNKPPRPQGPRSKEIVQLINSAKRRKSLSKASK